MSLVGKWFYERFIPDPGTNSSYVDSPIFHGRVVGDLGSGHFQVEIQPGDQIVSRIFHVSDMSDFVFVSTYEQVLAGIASLHSIIKTGADLDRTLADMQALIPNDEND